MRMRRPIVIAFLVVALLAAGCGGGDGSRSTAGTDCRQRPTSAKIAVACDSWVLGRWRGELTQKGLNPFMVWATVRSLAQAKANRVHYSGLDCRGRWVPLGGEGDSFRFREEITAGRSEECKGVGIVTLRHRAPDRVGYVFRGGGIESHGVLARRVLAGPGDQS